MGGWLVGGWVGERVDKRERVDGMVVVLKGGEGDSIQVCWTLSIHPSHQ